MVTQKQIEDFSGKNVNGWTAFCHPKIMAAVHKKFLEQKDTKIKDLEGSLKAAQEQRDAFGKELDKYKESVRAVELKKETAMKIMGIVTQIPAAALGDYEAKMNQAFINASRGELTLSIEKVDPNRLQEIFWDAVGELHKEQKLKLQTIAGQQYGAKLDLAILNKTYYMNADTLPGFVYAVAHATTQTEGEVSISVRDIKADRGGKLELEFTWERYSRLPGHMGALKEVAAIFGAEMSYNNGSAMVSLPYEK